MAWIYQNLHSFLFETNPDAGIELRTKWAQELMKYFATSNPLDYIRQWDFVATPDGSVRALTTEPPFYSGENSGYLARI